MPVLAERRGSAPATVAALRGQDMGTVEKPIGTSIGAHGLTRTLPAGLCPQWGQSPGSFAAEVAALTHGPVAIDAAAIGATIVHHIGQGQSIAEAAERAQREWPARAPRAGELPLAPALAAARANPSQIAELARLAPDARAMSALAGAVYVASSMPHREQVRDALLLAASASDGGHVAAVVGAFLGAAHGPDALPVDWVSRMELVWVADTLAGDLIRELVDSPSGSDYGNATDPHWVHRYPGW